jgi:hypothetical protein
MWFSVGKPFEDGEFGVETALDRLSKGMPFRVESCYELENRHGIFSGEQPEAAVRIGTDRCRVSLYDRKNIG